MSKLIAPAKLEHLLMVNHVRRDQPHLDLGQAVRAAISSTATREELLSVAARLVALTNTLANPELKPWVSKAGKDQSTVHMAVLKATARAPLAQPKRPQDFAFDPEAFKSILVEESSQSESRA